jgi:hypothetical protein
MQRFSSVEWEPKCDERNGITIEVGGFGLDPVKARVLKGLMKRGFLAFCISYVISLVFERDEYLN